LAQALAARADPPPVGGRGGAPGRSRTVSRSGPGRSAPMPRLLLVLLLVGASAPTARGAHARLRAAANPIRRVITMLQMMQQKVAEEGKRERELFDKFLCQCTTRTSGLEKAVEAATTKIPQLESNFKEAQAEQERLKSDVSQATSDRNDARQTLGDARGLRAKEAAAFEKEKGESQANVKALGKAVAALNKGAAGAFLQTSAAAQLRHLTATVDMSDSDRDLVSSFLAADASQNDGYAPASGEIVGILDQIKDSMEKELKDLIESETQAKKEFTAMEKAKEEQVGALTKMIEQKTARVGEVGVQLVQVQEDTDDTTKSLKEDTAFLANLRTNCGTRKDTFVAEESSRGQEQIAIAETIKILNDDDALDTFKKTLPTASFIQLKATHRGGGVREQALRVIEHAQRRGKSPHAATFALIALSLRQKQANFDKVVKMVDDMMELLKKEQADDDTKKAYCTRELDEAEDQKKELETEISDLGKVTEEGEDKVAALAEELAALSKGMRDLDKDVAEATEQRKSEHADFVENLAANNAAKELLGIAKNRLNKFYNPTQYDPGVGPEMANEQERIARNFGVTLAQEPEGASSPSRQAPALVQVRQHAQEAEPKRKESQGVLAMIDELVGVLDKEIQEMKVDDAKMQQAYETTTEDAAEKRATDAKTLAEKEAVKADMEAKLHGYRQQTKSTQKRRASAVEFIKDLHEECDWLAKNYEARKSARAGEVESLRQAKAVLAGADYGKK